MPDKWDDPGCDLVHLNKPRVKHFRNSLKRKVLYSDGFTAQYCNMVSIRIMPLKGDGNFRVSHQLLSPIHSFSDTTISHPETINFVL